MVVFSEKCRFFLFQYIWLASMAYVVYAALRSSQRFVGRQQSGFGQTTATEASPDLLPGHRRLPVVLGFLLLLLLTQRGLIRITPLIAKSDLNDCVHTGEDANGKILASAEREARPGADRPGMPESASNFWLYEDGWLSKTSTYWMFDCGSREECFKAVESLGGLRQKGAITVAAVALCGDHGRSGILFKKRVNLSRNSGPTRGMFVG